MPAAAHLFRLFQGRNDLLVALLFSDIWVVCSPGALSWKESAWSLFPSSARPRLRVPLRRQLRRPGAVSAPSRRPVSLHISSLCLARAFTATAAAHYVRLPTLTMCSGDDPQARGHEARCRGPHKSGGRGAQGTQGQDGLAQEGRGVA